MNMDMVQPSSLKGFEGRVVLAPGDGGPFPAHERPPRVRTSNRRNHRRLTPGDFRWLRAARLKYGAHVHVIDISAGGMLVETGKALAPDSKLVIELAGAERTILVACRVLRCEKAEDADGPRYRAACAFSRPLDLPDLVADAHLTDAVASDIVAGLDALGARLATSKADTSPAPEAPVSAGAWQKVIVRYRDGHILRGYTNNFHADRPQLHLSEQPCAGSPVMVPLSRLKALFFVREFAGDPNRVERTDFAGPTNGRKVEVTFHDGEVLLGSTISYRQDGNGFFVQPADPRSNNLRVFVILSAIQHVRFL